MAETETSGGSGVGKKFGPLPVWAWAVLAGGALGLVWFLRKSAAAGSATQDKTGGDESGAEPTTIVPVNQGLGADQAQAILDAIKDLQGEISKEEEEEDEEEPPPKSTLPAPVHSKPPTPKPPPRPKPPTKPKPPPKARRYVVTKKWTKLHTPWQSTLWGIAKHEKIKGGWQQLQKINHMHGDPRTHLQPGVKVYLE